MCIIPLYNRTSLINFLSYKQETEKSNYCSEFPLPSGKRKHNITVNKHESYSIILPFHAN